MLTYYFGTNSVVVLSLDCIGKSLNNFFEIAWPIFMKLHRNDSKVNLFQHICNGYDRLDNCVKQT